MPLSYTKADGIGRRVIPAPLVTVNKNYTRNPDGGKVGTVYSLTLQGTILPFKGSPSGNYSSLGTAFWTLGGYPPDESFASGNEDFNHILRKQEALRWLFNEDGGSLEWQPSGGQPVVKCNPRVLSIDFENGVWADRSDYTIQLEANWIFINGTTDVEDTSSQELLSSSSDSWTFEEVQGSNAEQYNITHEVTAQGILGFDETGANYEGKEAWEHAKDHVDSIATGSVDPAALFAAIGTSGTNAGNFVRVVRIDKNGGSYSVTEQWLASDEETRTESEFTVDFNVDDNTFTVTYRGTIFGVADGAQQGDIANLNAAKAAIPTNSQAKVTTTNIVGSLLNGQLLPDFPDNKSFVLNQQDGTVQFTFTWDTSDDANNLNVTETITSQFNYDRDSNLYTISLTQEVQGKGNTASQKLTNARGAVFSNSEARVKAMSFYFTAPQLGLDTSAGAFATNHKSRVHAVNEDAGSIRTSWTWDTRGNSGQEVNISTQKAADVIASIPVPGRILGPIIQDMNTRTSEIITVTIISKGHSSAPSLNTSSFVSGTTFTVSDVENFSPTTGIAQRTTRFLRDT